MISSRYSFEEFVNAVIHKNPEEVRDLAIKESDDVREILKSSGKNRSLGGTAQHYDHVLSGVALFVFQGVNLWISINVNSRRFVGFARHGLAAGSGTKLSLNTFNESSNSSLTAFDCTRKRT